jgi:hypothetical protein
MTDALSSNLMLAWLPALIPLLMALCGWLTLRLAQWSSLVPRQFVGLRPYFGWQAYFFGHIEDFITLWSRGLLEKLGTLNQVFEHIGPEKIISHQLARLRPQIDSFIDEVMASNHQVLWENLPILVKNRLYSRAHRMLPRIVDDIVEELGDSMRHILTYQQLLHFAEREHPGTLLRLYQVLSQRAFDRLALFCLYGGLAAGALQMLVALLVNSQSQMYWAITGAFIGAGFFWCCLRWYRVPFAPVRLGSFTWRSPYSRARLTQDRELADLLAHTVLSPRNIARTLIMGGKARQAHQIIRRRIAPLVEDVNIRTFAQLTVGPIGYVKLKQSLSDRLTDSFMEPFEDEDFNQARSKVLAEFLLARIESQPDQLFYGQMKRILDPQAIIGTCGGFIIGGLLGCLQWMLLSY